MKQLNQCPACGSVRLKFLYEGRTNRRPSDQSIWNIHSCCDCNHGFMNPQPDWLELASYYSDDYEAYDASHGATANDDAQEVALAKQAGQLRHLPLPTGKRVLDVGAGAGWFLRVARELGASVMGVEPSAVGAARARQSGLDIYHGTLEDYSRTEGRNDRFDIITANHVVEHVPDPVATLQAMKGLLAPGGMVWIAVPNPASWFGRKLLASWGSTDLPYHLQQFCAQSMAMAGLQAGLSLRRQYTHSTPSSVASSLRLHWRKYYSAPRMLTQRIGFIDRYYAPRLAAKLDEANEGEAIITEFVHSTANSAAYSH